MAIYKLKELCETLSRYDKDVMLPKYQEYGNIIFIKKDSISEGRIDKYKINEKYLFDHPRCINRLRSGVLVNTINPIQVVEKPEGSLYKSGMYLINSLNPNTLLNKYLYYWLCSEKEKIYSKYSYSNTMFNTMSSIDIESIEMNIPSVVKQKAIIDIIEPHEKLFLSHPRLVRLGSVQDAAEDIKELIDIIEPLEDLIKKLKTLQNKCKALLSIFHDTFSDSQDEVVLSSLIVQSYGPYEGQRTYYATNSVGEMSLNRDKGISLLHKKVPSRANITPQAGSILLSKLYGENKIYYFPNAPKEVFSTGFFCFSTRYTDSLVSFFLSESFKKQKKVLSTGTTMVGINLESLNHIILSKPTNTGSTISSTIFLLDSMTTKSLSIKNFLLDMLI